MNKPNETDAADIDWARLYEAARALGIDPETLPSREAMAARREADDPEPLPVLELQPLTKRQLAVIRKAMPTAERWQTAIPQDAFIAACRFLAATDFAWDLVPLDGSWSLHALRGRYRRCQESAMWGAVFQILQGPSGKHFSDDDLALFEKLAAAERVYLARLERNRKKLIRKVSKLPPFAKSRGV